MAQATGRRSGQTNGWYVYGIVPRDVSVLPDARGIGDPPAPVAVVTSATIGALVSEIRLDRPIGTPGDLAAHQSLLDAAAIDAPVLPMRFGAVLSSRDAVVEELLEPHEDEFADALRELTGDVQYVLRARYVEDVLLREIIAEDPTAAALRDKLADRPAESTRDIRVQLGERVNAAVEARRRADTDAMARALEPVTIHTSLREPTHEFDAAHLAMLVEIAREDQFMTAVRRLARGWRGRITARLLGPMAPYDFVVTTSSARTG